MTEQLFSPTQRDRAIETSINYLSLAGLIDIPDCAGFMMKNLARMDDNELARQLILSREIYLSYLESAFSEDKYMKNGEWF